MSEIDKKIKRLIKNTTLRNWRSLFIILGPSGNTHVTPIYKLLSKIKEEPQVLWCSNENVGVKSILKKGGHSAMKPYFCAYNDLSGIDCHSFDMAVLQDFNLSSLLVLNFILSTIKGGGTIILLLPELNTLEELESFNLSNGNQLSRFSQRFFQSLNLCPACMILDENLKVLSSSFKLIEKPSNENSLSSQVQELELGNYENDFVFTSLLDICLTKDQGNLLLRYLDVLKNRKFHAIMSVSSAFGRGKSAALGLAIAGAVAMNYSNIFITSSCHSNVNILLQFLLRGLDALNYKEDTDYDLIESANPKFNNALIGLNIFRNHPQSVRFIFPGDVGHKLEQAELVVIDEAASIPLTQLKKLIGPYVVLMASSISGARSTSPYVYDRMIENLQASSVIKDISPMESALSSGSSLQKMVLNEPIHYAADDAIEDWNNQLFCLKCDMQFIMGCPETKQCQLFCVSRDVLFNGSEVSEKFLQSLISIFNQSSYSVQLEDFVKLADSPDHQIFVLLPPFSRMSKNVFPGVLCAVLVHLESKLPYNIVLSGDSLRTVPMCFDDWTVNYKPLSMEGIHVLNLATHPSYKRMGYGLRAFQLLQEMYEGKWISLDETPIVDTQSSLLIPITEVQQKSMEYLCVSFNLTEEVFSFWKKAGFVPVYISVNKDCDKSTAFMMKSLTENFTNYLQRNWSIFINFYFVFLKSHFKSVQSAFALSFLHNSRVCLESKDLSKDDLDYFIQPYNMKALERYCIRLQDMNTIINIICTLAELYFKKRFKDVHLPAAQEAILFAHGLQNKTIDVIAKDLKLQAIQVIGLLNRTIKKLTSHLTSIIEKSVEKSIIVPDVDMKPLDQDLDEELEEAAEKFKKEQEQRLLDLDVAQYAIKGSEDEWQKALYTGRKTLVSIKSIKKKKEEEKTDLNEKKKKFKKPFKKMKK